MTATDRSQSPILPAETGSLLPATDWAATPLGPMSGWPRSLLGYVAMIMAMPTPAIIFWGPEQTQIYNDGYALIMGPHRHPRYFGAPYRESWPDTYPLIYPWMRQVLDHGQTWTVERQHIPVTRHGFDEEAYFTFTFSALRDDDGRIAGILQPVFDVTESVLADRRAETLRLLMPGQASPTEPVAEALAIIARNAADMPGACVWLRESEADGAGRLKRVGHAGALPAADDLARLDAAALAAWSARGGVVESPVGFGAGAGTTLMLPLDDAPGQPPRGVIALGASARLRFDAKYRHFLETVAHQVAGALQRASALQAAERQRQYLNDLFLLAPAGIAVTQGPAHAFVLVNPAYAEFTGYRGLVGKPLLEAMPELADQPFPAILDDVYRSGQAYVGTEASALLGRGPDGAPEEAFFNFVYQPLRDETGAVTGILIFANEVSEQVRARRSAERLADELRGEHRRKDDFLAMLAHELRNPLAPISAAAEVLRLGHADDDRLRRTSEIVTRQVGHMTGLIDDLLDASRVTRGIVTIERHREDLPRIVATAVEQVRPLVETQRHRLSLDLDAGDAFVRGDRKRLVQVVANLLDNAAKYSAPGGEIRLRLQLEPGEAVLRIADRGVGIAPELQPRVFDLFVQGPRSVDRGQGGLGIGLALVRSLVELHGGSVRCTSAGVGQGSEFVVRLPLVAAAPAPANAEAGGGEALAGVDCRLRVLVVDDNEDAARMLGLLLENAGHEVMIEHHPREALQRASTRPPDVCLLDIGLPGIDGNELARRLRDLPEMAGALLVAVTGYGQAGDRERALEAGFDHYLVKPPSPQAIAALLGEHCAGRA